MAVTIGEQRTFSSNFDSSRTLRINFGEDNENLDENASQIPPPLPGVPPPSLKKEKKPQHRKQQELMKFILDNHLETS